MKKAGSRYLAPLLCLFLCSCINRTAEDKLDNPLKGLWLGVSYHYDGQEVGFGNDLLISDSTLVSLIYPYDIGIETYYEVIGDSIITDVFVGEQKYHWSVDNRELILTSSERSKYVFYSDFFDRTVIDDLNRDGFNRSYLEENRWGYDSKEVFHMNGDLVSLDTFSYPLTLEFDKTDDYFLGRDSVFILDKFYSLSFMSKNIIRLYRKIGEIGVLIDYKRIIE